MAAAILLQYLAPSMVACYSFIFWKERVTPLKLAALVMSLIGCYLVVGGFDITLLKLNRAGIAWGLMSALAFASTIRCLEKGCAQIQSLDSADLWSLVLISFTEYRTPPLERNDTVIHSRLLGSRMLHRHHRHADPPSGCTSQA